MPKIRKDKLLILLFIQASAFALFAGTLDHPWIYDDFPVIVNNPDVRSLASFFENSYPGRPLRELSFLLDHALFGMEPAGWRIQTIFWHGLNAFLVWMLGWRLAGKRILAWGAALLFLVHPIQVEVVANISHRKDSLALAFCLFSVLSYTNIFRPEAKRLGWLITSALLALVAFSAKENVIGLPLVFVAYELAFVESDRRLIARKGFLATAAVLCVSIAAGWFFLLGGWELHQEAIRPLLIKMNYLSAPDAYAYYGLVLKCWVFMFLKFFLPLDLAPEYTFAVPESWSDPWVLSSIAGVVVYAALLWMAFRRRPVAFFALVWLGAFWLPVSNLWPLSYFAADRYLYAPSVGLFLLVGWIAARIFERRPLVAGAGVSLVIVSLVGLTWQQVDIWSSRLALWSHAARVSPESTWTLNNLGAAHLQDGEYAKALPLFQKAAKNFNDSITLYNIGKAYEGLGDRRNAIRYYQMFISMNDPKYPSEIRSLRRRLGVGGGR